MSYLFLLWVSFLLVSLYVNLECNLILGGCIVVSAAYSTSFMIVNFDVI